MASKRYLQALLVLTAIAGFRVAMVISWHQPAGDGLQYFDLAHELRTDHRFAFRPPPAPLSYSRLPGYPVFMAVVSGGPARNVSLNRHLRCATLWNVGFDGLTALLLFAVVRSLGLPRPWIIGVAVLLWPTLWLMSCYALTESISIALATVQLYCAVRMVEAPRPRHAVAAGIAAGLAQLIRLDALCSLPLMLCACGIAPVPRRRQLLLALTYLGVAGALFAVWPIRNLIRFGHPYFAATTLRTTTGTPLRDGPIEWMRTWADSAPGDSYYELYFVYENQFQLERPGVITPKLYETEDEKKELLAVLAAYNRDGLTEQVNRRFRDLAIARFKRHPVRTLVLLPLVRLYHLFAPVPQYEMPMQIRWLGLPRLRRLFGVVDIAVYLLAIFGIAAIWRSPRARWLPMLLLPILLRCGLYAFAIPQVTTQRYLVEAFPLFALLATFGVLALSGARTRTRTAAR